VATSIAELAHGEKSHTQSINHLVIQSITQLIDTPGTEGFAPVLQPLTIAR